MKARIDVSHEMLSFIGTGGIDGEQWPEAPVMLVYDEGGRGGMSVALLPDCDTGTAARAAIAFLVARDACTRLFPTVPLEEGRWHLPAQLCSVAMDLLEETGSPTALSTFRLAKSIELLCGTLGLLETGQLLPSGRCGSLTAAETERIVAARRLIDEHWQEQLTLDSIARASGTSRAQLTRGFRLMYDCTIGDAITDNRLRAARNMLLRTDLPVSSIGYKCGYRNSASFSRAFTRRFGVAPSLIRMSAS